MRINLLEAKKIMASYKDAEVDPMYALYPEEDADREELLLQFPQDTDAITELNKIYSPKAIAKYLGVRIKNVGWETCSEWEDRNDKYWEKGNKLGLVFEGSVEQKRRKLEEVRLALNEIKCNIETTLEHVRDLQQDCYLLPYLEVEPLEGLTVEDLEPIVIPEDWEFQTSMIINQLENKQWALYRQAKNLTEGE